MKLLKPLKPDIVHFPVRWARGQFFLDCDPGRVRFVKFPFYPDVTYWHRPTGLWDWLVRLLTRLEQRRTV